jgi:LCP family protein required for cell wall assembly
MGAMTDRPRAGHPALAAALSFLFPGLGQAYAGQGLLAAVLATPVLLLAIIVIVALAFGADSLRNQALSSSFLGGLLVLDVALALWRLFAIAQAGFAQPTGIRPAISGTAVIGQAGPGAAAVTGPGVAAARDGGDRARRAVTLSFVVLLLALTLAMHAYLFLVVRELNTTLGQVFDVGKPSTANSTTAPINQPDYHWNGTERINLLLLGIDSGPGRQEALSDTILVVSVDPVARTAALISIPRDTGFVPLPDRHVYADGRYPQKINQLASDAAANAALWCPDLTDAHTCGIRTLERSVGLYLGIGLQYYAQVDLAGFAKLIDALGGVRLCLDGDLIDPTYTDPARPRRMGITLAAGCHRYSGTDALAFARIRKGYLQLPDGTQQAQNDFKRAERQQEVLLALRSEFATGDVIFQLPGILSAIGQTVATDFPRDKVGDLATLLPLITGPDIERVVLGYPEYVGEPTDPEVNYLLRPKRSAIRAEMTRLFGGDLEGWYLGSTAAGPPRSSASAAPSSAP